ncbi:phage/plasmid primase, P4 family [Streptomyces anulatus]|uniref:phage/plasmid primase, P4 family n=1 Tax=Streptomyces anulatus TaxID=1892 RepID=UPI0033DD4E88
MTITAPSFPAQQVVSEEATDSIERAAHFAALGFGVFPMPTNKKMPISKGWPDLALTDAEEVEIYWRTFTPNGWQNIALTLDGWTVVDVDPKNGGTASMAKLLEKYELPLTRTHHTASGADSLHFIYRADPDRPLKSAPLNPGEYPGIDIKTGRGSLIVAPGSVIGGKRYQVVSEREAVVAPSWLSEIQQAAQYPVASSGRSRTPSRAPAGHPRGSSLAALRALPSDHPGRDNSWLCQVAGKLARKHTEYPAYLRELREIDSESEVPHEEGRFMKTADSIWSREQDKPAPAKLNADAKPVKPKSILWHHEHTDLGNGRRLRDLHGDDMRHASGWGWLTWDGRRWARGDGQARRFMHNVADAISGAIDAMEEKQRSEDLMRWFGRSCSGPGISASLNEASVLLPIETDITDFDADPYKLLVGNGVVDLKTGALLPVDRKFLLTRGTTVEYDPDGECPMWMDFLGWAFQGDVEMIEYIQRMFGMCLIGNNAHQVAFFLYGPGRSGKTTLTRVLSRLLGDYATSADLSVFNESSSGHNEPLARLAGARLAVFSETRQGQRINEAQFKKFTGEDTLTASYKNKSWFEFLPAFTPVMFGNAQPSIAFDSGVERRMKVVPMRAQISDGEKNPKLVEQMMLNEGPAIMAWAVEGARLAAAESFVPDPPQVAQAVKEYKRENDYMGEFIEECLVFVDGATVPSDVVWARYSAWVQAGGVDFVKKTDDRAGKSLLVRMLKTWSIENGTPIEPFKSSNVRKLRGVALAE